MSGQGNTTRPALSGAEGRTPNRNIPELGFLQFQKTKQMKISNRNKTADPTKRDCPVSTENRAPESTASRAREISRAWGN